MMSPGGLIRVIVGFLGQDSPSGEELTSSEFVLSSSGFAPGAGGCACAQAGASGNVKLVTLGAVRGILSATALGELTVRSGDSMSGNVGDARGVQRQWMTSSAG